MAFTAEVAAFQRLPYGGDVTARVISNLVRDLKNRVTTGESGTMILEANVPLLRGAGRVAVDGGDSWDCGRLVYSNATRSPSQVTYPCHPSRRGSALLRLTTFWCPSVATATP